MGHDFLWELSSYSILFITCEEYPKKMTVAQAVNPRTDVPSRVQLLLKQYSTLEISPLITIITNWLIAAWSGDSKEANSNDLW